MQTMERNFQDRLEEEKVKIEELRKEAKEREKTDKIER